MVLSKYADLYSINNKNYLFNLNNGAVIELDTKEFSIINGIMNFKYKIDVLNEKEKTLLEKFGFLVSEEFDKKQSLINHLTYSISKYNNHKNKLKIDFALTNKCNFCCPYCFEIANLNKSRIEIEKLLRNTSNYLYKYIKYNFDNEVKELEIVFYGGEPTLERNFIVEFIKRIQLLSKNYNVDFRYTFITNGFLFSKDFINKLDNKGCKFVQITLDGEKEYHNKRRTNINKINTFDTIINNINQLIKNHFYVVIRLNVDKNNFESIKRLIDNVQNLFDIKENGEYLRFDIARVFGTKDSYNLMEFETCKEILSSKLLQLHLIDIRINCNALTTFCSAESLTNDIVIDFKGDIYRCWNNVFDENYKINTIKNLLENKCDPYENSDNTIEFVETLSLENVNNKKCFSCKYCKYCQGLCPAVRQSIMNGDEMNIYNNQRCKELIKRRIKQSLQNIGD